VLDRYVPKHLIDRPKTGFGIPLDEWLRGPLKTWACALLSSDGLRRQGLFDVKRVEQKLGEHMDGGHNHSHWLWNALMFQAWYSEWCPDGAFEAGKSPVTSSSIQF
jgi:asparagine synthase (glutamine-hydrolysing)